LRSSPRSHDHIRLRHRDPQKHDSVRAQAFAVVLRFHNASERGAIAQNEPALFVCITLAKTLAAEADLLSTSTNNFPVKGLWEAFPICGLFCGSWWAHLVVECNEQARRKAPVCNGIRAHPHPQKTRICDNRRTEGAGKLLLPRAERPVPRRASVCDCAPRLPD
jgi:hypothetical protein